MSKLIINEGEFSIYEKVYNDNVVKKLDGFISLISKIKSPVNHNIKVEITRTKPYLLDIYGNEFEKDFFTNIDEEKVKKIIEVYDKYNLSERVDDIDEFIIFGKLTISTLKSSFILKLLGKKVIFEGDVNVISFDENKIENFEFKGNLSISNFTGIGSKRNVLFLNSKFYSELIFSGKRISTEITFDNCNINKFQLNDKIVHINDNHNLKGGLFFTGCSGNIYITDSLIQNFEILDSNFTNIHLINNIFNERVKISSSMIDGKIKKSNIGTLYFESNTINCLRIGHSNINNLSLINIKNPSNSEINLGNIIINKFQISNIRNLGKLRFYNVNYKLKENGKDLLSINESSLGDSEFQNFNLNSFKDIKIYDNLFSDLKYTGVSWGYVIKVDKVSNYGKLRNTYRTLKDVAEKNNDKVTALQFYAKEMLAYKNYIENKKRKIF